jgi:hypothetical protein
MKTGRERALEKDGEQERYKGNRGERDGEQQQEKRDDEAREERDGH